MAVRWLECSVRYSPEEKPNKQYTCRFVDAASREVIVKVSDEYLYVAYDGPPGAPYSAPGHLRVDLHDYVGNGNKAVIVMPVRCNLGVSDTVVFVESIKFSPPPVKKTTCTLRKMR